LIYENAAIYVPIQMLQLQLIRHFFLMNEVTFITEASAVVYISVVCRHILATNGCKSQALVVPTMARLSNTEAATPAATSTVGIAYEGITGYSPIGQKFCNVIYFERICTRAA
jgi:hypothetical protein